MSQLQLFEAAPQPQPNTETPAIASAHKAQSRTKQQSCSPHPKPNPQQTQPATSQAVVLADHSLTVSIAPQAEAQPARSTATIKADELVETKRITPAQSLNFNPLKQCRQCGAPIKHSGLDHSLCSGSCGWVVDLIWLAAHPPRQGCASVARSKEPEPKAATHPTGEREGETLDLFLYAIENHTSNGLGGAA